MPAYNLSDWTIEEEPFILVGIHAVVEPYRMAYHINKHLGTRFERFHLDQDITSQDYVSLFPVYNYTDEVQNTAMYLLPNKVWGRHKSMNSSTGLFAAGDDDLIKTTLIKEYSHVDFLMKIEREEAIYPLKQTLQKLKEIPRVISCYQLNPYTIKKQDYLIFD